MPDPKHDAKPDPRADSRSARSAAIEGWRPHAEALSWITGYHTLYAENPPYDDWFIGGELNLSANCTDRHLHDRADRPAVLWEGEPGDRRTLSYRELHHETLCAAAGLRRLGITAGDRIAIHAGWVPETVAMVLAAFRLGAEITVIPIVLPVESLSTRLADFAPKLLLTQDGGWRRGVILPLKARADAAIEAAEGIEHTVVIRRTGVEIDWFEGDRWYHEITAVDDPDELDLPAVALPAAHPAYAVYLANRGGEPVVIHLGSANIAVTTLANHRQVMSPAPNEIYWCAAEVSWVGGQLYGILGPLLAGVTAVMYEGTLDFPEPARAWQIVERYGVSAIVTSPSVVAALRDWSRTVNRDISTINRLVTIGEPLDQRLRAWLRELLGQTTLLADGWGQMELGGIVTYDLPGPTGLPEPGVALLDADGHEVRDEEPGEWALLHPWAGTMRSVEYPAEDPTAYHWNRYPGRYATGDRARRRPDGTVEFLGRYDEVTSIAGQLVSLNEVKQALLDHPFVAAAEAFEQVDTRLGRSVAAAIVLEPDAPDDDATLRDMQDSVRELLGGLSRPRTLIVLDHLDPSRVGPALHDVLARLAAGSDHGPVRQPWAAVSDALARRGA